MQEHLFKDLRDMEMKREPSIHPFFFPFGMPKSLWVRGRKLKRRLEEHVGLVIDKGLYKSVKGKPQGIPLCGKIPQHSLPLFTLSLHFCVQSVWVEDKLD